MPGAGPTRFVSAETAPRSECPSAHTMINSPPVHAHLPGATSSDLVAVPPGFNTTRKLPLFRKFDHDNVQVPATLLQGSPSSGAFVGGSVGRGAGAPDLPPK